MVVEVQLMGRPKAVMAQRATLRLAATAKMASRIVLGPQKSMALGLSLRVRVAGAAMGSLTLEPAGKAPPPQMILVGAVPLLVAVMERMALPITEVMGLPATTPLISRVAARSALRAEFWVRASGAEVVAQVLAEEEAAPGWLHGTLGAAPVVATRLSLARPSHPVPMAVHPMVVAAGMVLSR